MKTKPPTACALFARGLAWPKDPATFPFLNLPNSHGQSRRRPAARPPLRRPALAARPAAEEAWRSEAADGGGRGLPRAPRERRGLTRMTRRQSGRSPAAPQWGPPWPAPGPPRPASRAPLSDCGGGPRGALLPCSLGEEACVQAHPHVPSALLSLLHWPPLRPALGHKPVATWHTRRYAAPALAAPGTERWASPGKWRSSLASRAR